MAAKNAGGCIGRKMWSRLVRRSLFITTAPTPNPLSLIFIPNPPIKLLPDNAPPRSFNSFREAQKRKAAAAASAVSIETIKNISNQDPSNLSNESSQISLSHVSNKSIAASDQESSINSSESSTESSITGHPLARALFRVSGLTSVYLTPAQIVINVDSWGDTGEKKMEIMEVIQQWKAAGANIGESETGSSMDQVDTWIDENDSDTVKMIKELIETRIRPTVQEDGGDVIYRGFVDGIVRLEMCGSCKGCPSSAVTLKNGIEV